MEEEKRRNGSFKDKQSFTVSDRTNSDSFSIFWIVFCWIPVQSFLIITNFILCQSFPLFICLLYDVTITQNVNFNKDKDKGKNNCVSGELC